MQSGEAAVTAASAPRTVTPHAPGGHGLIHAGSGGSMSLADRLKQAALASSLGVGKAPADREPGVHAAPMPGAPLVTARMAVPGSGPPLAYGTVKMEHSSSGSGELSGPSRGDGSRSAAGGQGVADIMKQARAWAALTEADAALVQSASSAAHGGGLSSPPSAGRLLRAGTQTSGRILGGTQSMPHDLNVRLLVVQRVAQRWTENDVETTLHERVCGSCTSTYPVETMVRGAFGAFPPYDYLPPHLKMTTRVMAITYGRPLFGVSTCTRTAAIVIVSCPDSPFVSAHSMQAWLAGLQARLAAIPRSTVTAAVELQISKAASLPEAGADKQLLKPSSSSAPVGSKVRAAVSLCHPFHDVLPVC